MPISLRIKPQIAGGFGGGGRNRRRRRGGGTGFGGPGAGSHAVAAHAELTPAAIQDLGDIIPQILEIKNKANVPLVIKVQIEIGDKDTPPDDETLRALNQLLENIDEKFRFEK